VDTQAHGKVLKMDIIESRLEKADAEADKLWDAVYGEKKEPVKEETITNEVVPEEKVVDETPKETVVETAVPVEDVAKPDEKKPEEKKQSDDKDYKQMYKTLEGKYRAEVPRL
jgi:hypothetical protein